MCNLGVSVACTQQCLWLAASGDLRGSVPCSALQLNLTLRQQMVMLRSAQRRQLAGLQHAGLREPGLAQRAVGPCKIHAAFLVRCGSISASWGESRDSTFTGHFVEFRPRPPSTMIAASAGGPVLAAPPLLATAFRTIFGTLPMSPNGVHLFPRGLENGVGCVVDAASAVVPWTDAQAAALAAGFVGASTFAPMDSPHGVPHSQYWAAPCARLVRLPRELHGRRSCSGGTLPSSPATPWL